MRFPRETRIVKLFCADERGVESGQRSCHTPTNNLLATPQQLKQEFDRFLDPIYLDISV